jgi:hypothetical protein
MKGHDGLCPSPNPGLVDRKNCTYCNLIQQVKEHYKSKTGGGTYEDGVRDGFAEAIKRLQDS